MKTNFEILDTRLTLRRYPEHLQHPSWQAWDSADEYIIEHIESLELDTQSKNLLILNDESGALACWFACNSWQNIDWQSDSFVSTQCCQLNLENNNISITKINFLDSLSSPKENVDVVLLKLPKISALLEYQLIELQKVIHQDTLIIAAGKAKNIQKSTLALFKKHLGETTTSLAKKKSRLIFVKHSMDKNHENPYPTTWKSSELPFKVSNHANVFARQQLDIGGRFFIQNLPDCSGKSVIDLGCGNGVVGLSVLEKYQDAKVIFVDESYMAIASAKLNVEQNFADRLMDCEFVVTNCLDGFESEVDIVLCNPPFHQQNGITDHIAVQMFKDAKRVLKAGGELRVVGNRHLGYHQKLNELFGSFKTVANNRKFSVLVSNIMKN